MARKAAFTPLDLETRTHICTAHAAHLLGRTSHCLRRWAMTGKPIAPVKFNGRLAWPVAELRRVLAVPSAAKEASNV